MREYIYAYAAVSPTDGRMSSLILPWVDTHLMSLFLAHTASPFSGEPCVMFFDQAGWHRAHQLKVPKNMSLLPLPPYSPELNPAEHVWEYIRENHTRNRIFDDLDQVVETGAASLHELHNQPQMLQSMTAFPWILKAA